MPLHSTRPITPTQRFRIQNKQDLYKGRPYKKLTESKKRTGGRNCYGRMTSRRRGGGHKKLYRIIDFRRRQDDVQATVLRIEYDPNRSSNIALIEYANEAMEKAYIIAPKGIKEGAKIMSSANKIDFDIGNSMPVKHIPPATFIHCLELEPGRGAKIARGAGQAAQLIGIDGEDATIKMPSGEIRLVNGNCRATIGIVGNSDHQNTVIAKAGRNRWLGKRPRVRGVAMNPVDHPMGGGEAKTSGGGHPVSPWGQLSKGFPTRRKSKTSNKQILVRRNGRKMKR